MINPISVQTEAQKRASIYRKVAKVTGYTALAGGSVAVLSGFYMNSSTTLKLHKTSAYLTILSALIHTIVLIILKTCYPKHLRKDKP